MINNKKKEWAAEALRQKCKELGRLPRKSDFDVVTLSRIKAFLGPWPRALEAAGLKESKKKNGEIVFEKCMPIGVVMDERICSGHDFAIAFRYFSKLMEDPTLLETPPEEVVTDPAL